MAVRDIYSKRKRRLAGHTSDVYVYDEFPAALRNQLVYVVRDIVGVNSGAPISTMFVYADIARILAREWGVVRLVSSTGSLAHETEVIRAIREVEDTDHVLDIIELAIELACEKLEDDGFQKKDAKVEKLNRLIGELNFRLKEGGVGYECSNFQMMRIDSQLIHSEVVKPAVSLLSAPGFEGALDEFLVAYEHFRHRRYKEAINDALKAFESTIKVIAGIRGWGVKKGDTANKLVKACMDNGLFPNYYESHMSALTNLLVGGVPGIRNAEGGHGQGAVVKEIEPHTVAYALHMTASAIVLFVQSHEALPVAPNEPNEQSKET